ncbi:MAG: NAD(P)-dependent oxidoreductase [Planctomycetes bacterium]|nr:NAD(P)-dependent oxidoreductase [Planctomycetota bacterium]
MHSHSSPETACTAQLGSPSAVPLTAELWLLTGASGLLGRALAAELRSAGLRLRVLEHRRACASLGDELVRATLEDERALARALDGVRGVVHAAAVLEGTPAELEAGNARGTERLASAAARAGAARFVFVSTAAVYAPGSFRDADEAQALGPEEPYGASKLSAERAAEKALGERLAIARLPSLIGNGRSRFLEQLAGAVLHHRLPRLPDGGAAIELVHVNDAAAGIRALAEAKRAAGAFHFAAPERLRYRELMELVAAELGCLPRWTPIDGADESAIEPVLLRFATQERTLSCARARELLGYRPRWDPVNALRAAFASHRASAG